MNYFGTDGLRGIINKDLTIEFLQKLGRAISILKKYISVMIQENLII
jgi:phosphomannomutase